MRKLQTQRQGASADDTVGMQPLLKLAAVSFENTKAKGQIHLGKRKCGQQIRR
jgi:hypothetical protein